MLKSTLLTIAYAVAAFCVLAAWPLAAHAACDSLSVTILPFEPVYDYSVSYREITGEGDPTFGTTTVHTTARVDGCTVIAGYAKPVVRVAAELKRDDCAFEHVLTHEEEHVRIYRESLSTLAARIQSHKGDADLFDAVVAELYVVKPLHAAHDNEVEYHTNITACSGRILKLAGLRLR